jgi:hypothetical protein
LKGNKTNELWRYVLPIPMSGGLRPERREGVMSSLRVAGTGAALAFGPNPARRLVNLSVEDGRGLPSRVRVYDATGREVMARDIAGSGVLDLGRLATGVYLMRLEVDGNPVSRKLVIQR